MKPFEKSGESALALQADLPWRRLGPPASCRTQPSVCHTLAEILRLTSVFDTVASLPGRSTKWPRASRSALCSPQRPPPPTRHGCFLLSSRRRRGLSGSVQWQCIRIGSGDVPLFSHTFGPNQCRYTTKHYAALFLGGLITGFPAVLALMWPGRVLTSF